MRWHQMGVPTRKESRTRLEIASQRIPYRRLWSYVIEHGSEGIIGHVEVYLLSSQASTFELSFGLMRSHRHRGIMTLVLNALTAHWFFRHKARKIFARTLTNNVACRRLLTRLGFVKTPRWPLLWNRRPDSNQTQYYVLASPIDSDRESLALS